MKYFFTDFPSYHYMVAFRLAVKQSRRGNLCHGIVTRGQVRCGLKSAPGARSNSRRTTLVIIRPASYLHESSLNRHHRQCFVAINQPSNCFLFSDNSIER